MLSGKLFQPAICWHCLFRSVLGDAVLLYDLEKLLPVVAQAYEIVELVLFLLFIIFTKYTQSAEFALFIAIVLIIFFVYRHHCSYLRGRLARGLAIVIDVIG